MPPDGGREGTPPDFYRDRSGGSAVSLRPIVQRPPTPPGYSSRKVTSRITFSRRFPVGSSHSKNEKELLPSIPEKMSTKCSAVEAPSASSFNSLKPKPLMIRANLSA